MEGRRLHVLKARAVAVHHRTGSVERSHADLTLSRRLALSASARPFLASGIGFGKALFPCFGFPIIISDSAAISDDSAAKLTKH